MLTEAAVRAFASVAVPERKRLAAMNGKPLADAAALDPRASVAGVLVTYSVLMIALLLVGAVLGGAGVLNGRAAFAGWMSAIRFFGAGAVLQGIRIALISPLLRDVRMGQWHPSRPWLKALAYPRDTDFLLQAVAAFLLR